MTRVYLSIGSNIERERYISAGLDALQAAFGRLTVSPVYESEAVGFEGDPFFNLAVGLDTDLSVGELSALIKDIERDNGRERSQPRFSARTLDIDILTYGEQVGDIDGVLLPRDEILQHAFVLLPLAHIAPDTLHPSAHQSFAQLWTRFKHKEQQLWPASYVWQPRQSG